MRTIRFLTITSLLAACTADTTTSPKGGDPFALQDSGKADGGGLLSAADEERVKAAFDDVIERAESTIVDLENEISRLEASHAAKEREANDLVNRIAARERELRDQYNNNLFLCGFFPNPATCVLANYLANDSTLRDYRNMLNAARAEQARLRADIASYGAKRDRLRAKLVPIREGKDRLVAILRDGITIDIPAELAGSPPTATAYRRAIVMGELTATINSEIAVLVEIRDAALDLDHTIDDSLKTLRALEQSVDELVQQQREQFMDLLTGLLSDDPAATAEDFLEDQLAARTRADRHARLAGQRARAIPCRDPRHRRSRRSTRSVVAVVGRQRCRTRTTPGPLGHVETDPRWLETAILHHGE